MMEWFSRMFGRRAERKDEPMRADLDAQERNIASRLSKLTGRDRDAVLAEAYRRADAAVVRRSK